MSEPRTIADRVREYTQVHAKREQDLIEAMVERMLVTPDAPGISVQRTWKGSGLTLTCETTVRLDSRVEFGTIGYLPDIHEPGF